MEVQERFGTPGPEVLDRLREARTEEGPARPEDLAGIARRARWPVAGVTAAATYYADLTGPHATRHVRVCEGTSCFASSQGRHIPRLEEALGVPAGGSSPDGSVSLQVVRCLGYCYESPAALDGEQPRTGQHLGGLIGGAEATPTAPEIPHVSAVAEPVVLAGLLGTEGSWQVWPQVVTSASAAEVVDEITASGLRGRGGAEFPVGRKWSMAAAEHGPRFVVANGDEGDPGSYCDRLLMEGDPHRILEGLALAGFAVGAEQGLVLVRSEYPAAVARMREAVREAREAGHLGRGVHGTPVDFDVQVVEGAGSYVAGEETALMRTVRGLPGRARPRPPYPTSSGLLNRPTVLNNVETLAAVPWILRRGGAAYAGLGAPDEPGTKLVCLSQLFRRPGVYEVELGVPLRHLVEELGGGLREPHRLRAVQIGGPLGGFLTPDQLDLPLLAGPLARAEVALGHASLVAIDAETPATELLRHVWRFGAGESCGACTPCRVGARRGLELADQVHSTGSAAGLARAQAPLLQVLDTASLCAFGRGLACAVRSLVRAYPDELGGH